MVDLPAEVLQSIILNNLDSGINRLTLKSRAHELLSYALVSPAFRTAAQIELFHHVFVEQVAGVSKLLDSIEVGGQRLQALVQNLTIWEGSFRNGGSRIKLEQLFKRLSSLQKLVLFMVSINLETIGLAPKLESLTFFRGSLYSDWSNVTMPIFNHLKQLHLFTIEPDFTAAEFFTPTFFPILTTLQLWNTLDIKPFLPLFPTLINYSDHSRSFSKECYKLLQQLESIELLTENEDYLASLNYIPSQYTPLKSLRIRMGRVEEMNWVELAKKIEEDQVMALKTLEIMWIPAAREEDDGMEEFLRVVKEKGIELRISEVAIEFEDWLITVQNLKTSRDNTVVELNPLNCN